MKTVAKDFMKATYPANCSDSPQDQGAPQPPLELPIDPSAVLIPLPASDTLAFAEPGLRAVIERRRTLRRYSDQALTLEELSYLLWLTQGVKETTRRPVTLRNVPSAGARHAFETYLLVNNVEGLEAGLYRFAASQHALLRLDSPGSAIREAVTQACYDQQQIYNSAVTFLWVAVAERMTWRYVERGYRYLHLDAGHVCQNLCLAAEAVGCGVCPIAAFNDEQLNLTLNLDGENLFVIYLASLGKREG